MSGAGRLAWYGRRLASMSPPELAHRVIERGKQFADSRRRWGWDAFAYTGAIQPLPALRLERAIACLAPEIERRASGVLAGEIEFLSARWPQPAGARWWRTDLWTLDPALGQHWPGRGSPASKSVYRHAHGYGDVKFVWELNRLQYLMPLAIVARRDRDAGLAADIADLFGGWMDANPPFDGINWTNGIEAATRVVVALTLNTLLADFSPAGFRDKLGQFLAAHVWILARYPSLHSSANNHRIAELTALYLAYGCAPDLPGAKAGRAHEKAALMREIGQQFHTDGIGAEQSPTYAAYSLEWFLLAAISGEAWDDGFGAGYAARLTDAATALRWMMDEAGRTPAIGDDDEGRVVALGPAQDYLYPAAICSAAARWLGQQECAPPAQPVTLLDAFIEGPAQTASAPIGVRTFVQGGYTVWRAPGPHGNAVLSFDHGPLGFLAIAAHGHADALSVWLHIGGEPLLVDAGTYLYHTEGGGRSRFRGTLAHNTLAIADADQSQIAGPFNWSRHAKTELRSTAPAIVAAHDGYLASHNVVHVRSVQMDGSDIEIIDSLEGSIEAPVNWSGGFTFHPAVTLQQTESGVAARLSSGARAIFRVGLVSGGAVALQPAEISPGFGRLAATQRLVYSGQAQKPGTLASIAIELD